MRYRAIHACALLFASVLPVCLGVLVSRSLHSFASTAYFVPFDPDCKTRRPVLSRRLFPPFLAPVPIPRP